MYFKEMKQHLGFLKEEMAILSAHAASMPLCGIGYLMLIPCISTGH
jgi:hypothetical protein